MGKKRTKILKPETAQNKADIQANIMLLSAWQQAQIDGKHRFIFGMMDSHFAIHINPGTKAYSALQAVIEAELEQAGMDLIGLDLAGLTNQN